LKGGPRESWRSPSTPLGRTAIAFAIGSAYYDSLAFMVAAVARSDGRREGGSSRLAFACGLALLFSLGFVFLTLLSLCSFPPRVRAARSGEPTANFACVGAICAICLEPLGGKLVMSEGASAPQDRPEEAIAVLECGHAFHAACMWNWHQASPGYGCPYRCGVAGITETE
jgi:hypothetical protein